MYRTITVISTACVLLCSLALAMPGAGIRVSVVDAGTGEALPGASVTIEGTNRGAITDQEGIGIIGKLGPRTYRVIVTMVGYATGVKKVSLEGGGTKTIKFVLEESPLEMQGIVVTGTRTPRYIKDTPVYTEVITKQAIIDKAAHNLYEALDNTPGIRVEQQCQFCNFSVLRMQGLGADHTQILLDGQPVYSGLASVYGLQQLSTADIDQIEVVKGAGSALYGSNAIAGAINIISSIPQKTKGHVGVEFGEYSTNKYEVAAGIRNENLAFFVFGQQNKANEIDQTGDGLTSDEVKNPDGVTDRVRTNSKNLGFNLYIEDLSETDVLILRGRSLHEIRQGGELIDDAWENPFTPGTERIITDRFTGAVGYKKQFRAGDELNIDFSFTRHKRNATNDTYIGDYEAANGELPPVDDVRPYIANENLYTATINYVHPIAGSHRVLAGAQIMHNELEESGRYIDDEGNGYTSYSEKKADEFGAYVQDEFAVTDKLELVGGVRVDHHKSKDNFRGSADVASLDYRPAKFDETSVNPRFAVKFRPAPELTLRGSFGTGFRVPYGFSEDMHLCSGSPRIWKGSDLEPERSTSFSVSADYTLPRMSFNISLYRTDLKNKIDFADAGPEVENLGYSYQWKNIGNAFVMGAEFGAKSAVTHDLALAVDFAYNKGEYDNPRNDWIGTEYEEKSRKISRYPETAGGLKVEYSPLDWRFILDGQYKGKMFIDYFMDDEEPTKIKETESFIILNARVSYTFLDCYTLYIGGRNLTDYIQQEKHTDDAAFMYAPVYGRIIYGGFRIDVH